jgi:hypothetical protein
VHDEAQTGYRTRPLGPRITLSLIETVARWEGRLTTVHLIQHFGISRQHASKDINTYISEHAA